MSHALIRAGFETALKAWADAQTPAIPVAWPNVRFVPPAGGSRYLRADLIPAPTKKKFLDGTGRTWRGLFQVTFSMPPDTGAGTVEALAAALDAAFADSFTSGAVRIYLLEPFSIAPALPHPSRYVVPVTASYRADTV